jgi:hypothetical protein
MGTTWASVAQPNLLMDVDAAARYAGVTREELQAAITGRHVPAITNHPRRPGVSLVRLRDVDAWLMTWPQVAAS